MRKLNFKISLVLGLCLTVFIQLWASNSRLTCDAFFSYETYSGPNPVFGGITFNNQSSGIYTNISWDFGDGNISNSLADSVDHFYTTDGVYNVCLSIWDDQGCLSTFCSDVIVGELSDICNLTDCVFPGDANKDGEANLYDLLELGIGHGTMGPERPNATTEWVGQLAPDWIQETTEGINYKHLDCDGNGVIDDNDILPITDNYIPMDNLNPNTEASAPLIYIEFDQDSIFISDDSFVDFYEVKAHLKVGTPDFPATNIYGLAMYLGYPGDLVSEEPITFDYNGASFLGEDDAVLWGTNNQYGDEQLDIGVTRIDGASASGDGEIGEIVFIVSSDILDGRVEEGDVHFPLSINGVKMTDIDGNELSINLTNEPATLVFAKEEKGTATNDLSLAAQVNLFPNPTSDKIMVDLGDLTGTQLQIFDNFGREILQKDIWKSKEEIQVGDWNTGIYFVKIQTEQGVVSKRFVLK